AEWTGTTQARSWRSDTAPTLPTAPRYADGMATVERAEEVGIRPIETFAEAHTTWPRGDRPAAMREAAAEFRDRFKSQGTVRAIRTIDLASAGYPASYAVHGAARGPN